MNPAPPRVVALVPAFNAAAFVKQTLDSLAAQTYPNLHVLISNDASTDETGSICDEYAGRDHRFSVQHQAKNLGWIGNVNTLLPQVDGYFFFFAAHDDVLRPEYVQILVEALQDNPQCVLAFSDIDYVMSDGNITVLSYPNLDNITDRFERCCTNIRLGKNWWIPFRGIVRSDVLRLIGGLRRNVGGEHMADWPWILELLTYGPFIRCPEILYQKTWRASGVSNAWKYNPLSSLAVVLSCARVENACCVFLQIRHDGSNRVQREL